MFVNKDKLKELMAIKTGDSRYPNGNYNMMARELGVDVAQLHRVLNSSKHKAGPEFLSRLAKYCLKEGLNCNDYIFLDEPFHGSNGEKTQS